MSGQAEVRAFLGLGGNLGDPRQSMAAALQAIDADPASRVIRVSGLYRTPPWGKTDQPDFINATAEIATTRGARELLELCLGTERSLKRVRNERWGPRTVDLDIHVAINQHVEVHRARAPALVAHALQAALGV